MDAAEGWGLGGSGLLMTVCIILSSRREKPPALPRPPRTHARTHTLSFLFPYLPMAVPAPAFKKVGPTTNGPLPSEQIKGSEFI